MRKTRAYPPEFRREAVDLYRNSDKSLEEVAAQLGIGPTTLHRWHSQERDHERQPEELTPNERAELRRLRRENRRLKEEREILRKAAAFFARENETR